MTAPHRATPKQWEDAGAFASDTHACLLELRDRIAALEAAFTSHGEQISGLHSQHNLVVDSITDLQGSVNALEAAATPPPAPDHFPDATEMVATDDHLIRAYQSAYQPAWERGEYFSCHVDGLRAVYELDRQHGAQPRQEGEPTPLPAPAPNVQDLLDSIAVYWPKESLTVDGGPTPPPAPAGDLPSPRTVAAELLEECQSHEPGSPMRQLLSAAAILLDRYASDLDGRPQPTPPLATAGENVVAMVIDVIHFITGEHVADSLACGVIHAVADWLQQRSDTIANGSQWAEMLRGEADR